MNYFKTHISLIFVVFLIFFVTSVSAWKKDEFRNCNQTPFCSRARSRKPNSCSLIAVDVSIFDGDLVAKLVPKNPPPKVEQNPDTNEQDLEQGSQDPPSNPLLLRISAYQDGILRFKIDEDPSLNPPKKRFEVPTVIVSEFLEKKLWLQRFYEEKIDGDSGSSSLVVVYLGDGYEAVLLTDPFEVFVREKNGGKRVISLNSHGLFDFEQLRVKKEGDNWEENFRGHTDTRPYGAQSISCLLYTSDAADE